MNERDLTALLERRAAAVPTSEPPIDAILDAARADSSGRRRRNVLVGAAAAVTLIVASGVAWVAMHDRSTAEPTDSTMPVHEGFRWVGINGIAFEVPAAWTTSDGVCAGPGIDTVVFDRVFAPDSCHTASTSTASSLHLGTDDFRNFIAEMAPPRAQHEISIDGISALRTGPIDVNGCTGASPDCTPLYGVSIASADIPSSDVLAWIISPSRSTAVEIAASARVIPDGYLAIPSVVGMEQSKAAEKIDHLGVHPEALCPEGGRLCDGDFSVAQTDPLPGSIVKVGSAVQVLVADARARTLPLYPTAVIRMDGTLELTTYGSSSCPWQATNVSEVGMQHAVVQLRLEGGPACTSDYTAATTRIALPAGIDVDQPVIVELFDDDGQPIASVRAVPALGGPLAAD